ncbi:MAG: hypothetical protein Kow0069_35610 [Promethearchaeota archaeon]
MPRPRDAYFYPTAIRRLMKSQIDAPVSRGAIEKLVSVMEKTARSIAATAAKLAEHAGRKRVTEEDVRLAIAFHRSGEDLDSEPAREED